MTTRQFDRLANMFENAGQIVLGVSVVTPLFAFDKIRLDVLFYGLGMVVVLWGTSFYFSSRNGKEIHEI